MLYLKALGKLFVMLFNNPIRNICSLIGICITAIALHILLKTLPDNVMLPLFCRVPAEAAALWFNAPLSLPSLTYTVNDLTFQMARSCSGETFFSIAFAILLWRRPCWSLAAYPLTLFLNSLRAILTATLTLHLHGWRFEGLAHLVAGATLFIGTLYLLWALTERTHHDA